MTKKLNGGSNDGQVTGELQKSNVHIIVEVVEYIPKAVVSKTILLKVTGNVTAMSFDSGEELGEKTAPFDTYIQIIDGAADIEIDRKVHKLILGNGIIIPANRSHCFYASEKFKMISTVIKSGYED